jgi:hypothetical protein
VVVIVSVELALAGAIILAGLIWWQLWKRRGFLKRAIHDTSLLGRVITPAALNNPTPHAAVFAAKKDVGYVLNIKVLLDADSRSQRLAMFLSGVIAVGIFVGSIFLGRLCLGINLVLFCLCGLKPLGNPARLNAIEQIVELAVILFRWNREGPDECAAFGQRTHRLCDLYATVTGLHLDAAGP